PHGSSIRANADRNHAVTQLPPRADRAAAGAQQDEAPVPGTDRLLQRKVALDPAVVVAALALELHVDRSGEAGGNHERDVTAEAVDLHAASPRDRTRQRQPHV